MRHASAKPEVRLSLAPVPRGLAYPVAKGLTWVARDRQPDVHELVLFGVVVRKGRRGNKGSLWPNRSQHAPARGPYQVRNGAARDPRGLGADRCLF